MDKQIEISKYEEYWINANGTYVLVSLAGTVETAVVFDKETKSAIIIEDNNIAIEVAKRMYEAGVPLLTRIPH